MIQREYFTAKNLANNIVVAIVFATLLIMLYAAPLAADNNQMDLSSESKDHVQLIIASEMNDIAHPKLGLFAQLKTFIDQERRKTATTFFLFGGGSIGPSAFSNLDRGSHIIDLLNSLEPDAMGTSKREYSYNVDELSLRSYEAAFPIVTSNIIDMRINKAPDGLANMALISRNNTKLGFISISNKRLIEEYLLNDIVVQDPRQSVIERAQELRDMGADIIILHYFNIFDGIDELLNEDIINYAFNSNTRLREQDKRALANNKRIFLLDEPGQVIVALFENTENFPLLSVQRKELNELYSDPIVQNQVNGYLTRLNRLLDDNIAYWANDSTTRREELRSSENGFANYVADAMREFGKAEIAIINSGSIRGDRLYKRGEQITRRTIATELPFRSTLTTLSISGQHLVDALEVGFAGIDLLKGAFAQVSGMRIVFDSSKPQGERVVSVMINEKPLDKAKMYLLATTDYLAAGGDGYTPLTKAEKKIESTPLSTILTYDLVLRTLQVNGTLDSQTENRIVDVASRN